MPASAQENWIVFGASSGIGEAFVVQLLSRPTSAKLIGGLKLVSRRAPKARLFELAGQANIEVSYQKLDVNNKDELVAVSNSATTEFDRLIYFPGGGPYGPFGNKEWKDHEWAWGVTFLAPAFLLHRSLGKASRLKQFVVVGSSIAEDRPDPMAASYSAGKHALKGLLTTVQKEARDQRVSGNARRNLDVRLFSPGYVDTPLLPINSAPRLVPNLVVNPSKVAATLIDWMDSGEYCGHLTFDQEKNTWQSKR